MFIKDRVSTGERNDSASPEQDPALVANIISALLHCYLISFINVKCINMLYFYSNI